MERLKSFSVTFTVVLVLSMALFLRVYRLNTIPGLSGDEAYPTVQMHDLIEGKPVMLWVPTQRILSPVYATWVLLASKILPSREFWTVRLPALLAGLLAIALSFFSLRSSLGNFTAGLVCLIMSSLPMNIAYSRSAVEQCLMGAVGIFSISQALKGSQWGTFWAFVLAVLSHPVNVFLAPFLISILFSRQKNHRGKILIGFAAVILVLLYCLPAEYGILNLKTVTQFLIHHPLEGIQAAISFGFYFIRVLTGVTAMEYFAYPPSSFQVHVWDFLMGTVLLLFIPGTLKLRKDQLRFSILMGFYGMILILFYVAGPRALGVGLSRHSNVLLAPFSLCIVVLLESFVNKRSALLLGTTTFCLALMVHFYWGYFKTIEQTGGGFTHRTYTSGPEEPKKALFDWAETNGRTTGQRMVLLAEDWWLYWPLKFLSLESPWVEVIHLDGSFTKQAFLDQIEKGAVGIGFNGMKIDLLLKEVYQDIESYSPSSYSSQWQLSAFWRRGVSGPARSAPPRRRD